jgi:lipopolysaccharide/colanic/teichoic acid biosynthesis glycosyltransferase
MLEFLKKHDISNVFVCLGKEASSIREYFDDGRELGLYIRYSIEEAPQGPAGCLRALKPILQDDPFLLLSGSLLADFDLQAMLDFHHQQGSLITVGIHKDEECKGFPEIIEIRKGQIEAIFSPYHGDNTNRTIRTAGIFVISPAALTFMNDESYIDLKEQLIPRIREAGLPVFPYWINSFCKRIDTWEDYLACARVVAPTPDIREKSESLSNGHFEPMGNEAWEAHSSRRDDHGNSGLSILTFCRRSAYPVLKRVIDFTAALALLVLALPLWLLLGLAIKLDSPGTIFFGQKRCGKSGREFTMWKFRSMVQEAERLQPSLVDKNKMDGPMFKMTDDPRLTRAGRLVRNTSLDEWPQLINVLLGEMSLVGPRPLKMEEMKYSPAWRDTRLRVKPGITGIWQVYARGSPAFQDWIICDTYYVEHQSLRLDLKILLKTGDDFAKTFLQTIGKVIRYAVRQAFARLQPETK